MRLFECKAEVRRNRIDGIEAAIAGAAQTRWIIREDRSTGRAWLVGFFAARRTAIAAWRRLAATLEVGSLLHPASVRRLPDREWRESYRTHFRAWHHGRVHWVPVWMRSTYRVPRGAVVVWLDPGPAFGTGNHPTTRLCCERLVAHAAAAAVMAPPGRGGVAVVDAGCGSGILAISAARLGLGPVIGFDHDPEAIRVSRRNAALNRTSGRIRLFTADLKDGLKGRAARLVLANLQTDVLIGARRKLVRAILPGGWLVLGGILASELASIQSAFAFVGPAWRTSTRRMGEWADWVLVRPR